MPLTGNAATNPSHHTRDGIKSGDRARANFPQLPRCPRWLTTTPPTRVPTAKYSTVRRCPVPRSELACRAAHRSQGAAPQTCPARACQCTQPSRTTQPTQQPRVARTDPLLCLDQEGSYACKRASDGGTAAQKFTTSLARHPTPARLRARTLCARTAQERVAEEATTLATWLRSVNGARHAPVATSSQTSHWRNRFRQTAAARRPLSTCSGHR